MVRLPRRKGPTLAEEIVAQFGPERTAAMGRKWTRWAVFGLVFAQVTTWTTFFLGSQRSPLGAGAIFGYLVTIVLVAIMSITSARSFEVWVTLVLAANILLLILADFAGFYWSSGTSKNWNMALSHWDALFVATGTLTTAGAPGIEPRSDFARRLLTMQMGIDLVVFTLVAGVVVYKLTARKA